MASGQGNRLSPLEYFLIIILILMILLRYCRFSGLPYNFSTKTPSLTDGHSEIQSAIARVDVELN